MCDRDLLKTYCEMNRAAWEEVTPRHRLARQKQDCAERLRQPGVYLVDVVLKRVLDQIDLAGKDVVHFCCNDGEELISIKKMGAGRCVGIDICESALAEGRKLAGELGLACEFVHSDVYEVGDRFDEGADIAMVTVGGINWLGDLKRFFGIVSRTLRPGGIFIICDVHPYLNVFDQDFNFEADIRYFEPGPYMGTGDLDYFSGQSYGQCEHAYFSHTFSSIINGLIANGLHIERLDEYPDDIAYFLKDGQTNQHGLPLSYSVITRKKV